MTLPPEAEAAVVAAAELVGRTGATNFQIGYLRGDVPADQAGWYAHAQYRGARIAVEDQADPVAAAELLARRLLDGAQCQHCQGVVSLDPAGQYVGDRTLVDGTAWTAGQQAAAGVCVWRRDGRTWRRGCEDRPAGPEPTTARLARALAEAGAPIDMVDKARRGHYDDFKSPLAMPINQLVADARGAGLADIAARAIRGEFDATHEESAAWVASPEGQQALTELTGTAAKAAERPPWRANTRHGRKRGKR